MTSPAAVIRSSAGIPLRRRAAARVAVMLAHVLARLSPRQIRKVLRVVAVGARPATYAQAERARDAVVAVSLACAGPQGCLPRSLATTLLCRLTGTWAVWCVGARKQSPFGAHSWVEAEGRMVGESLPADYFVRLVEVGSRWRSQRG